ncbi:hypothetical protein FB451DRAFT_1025728 [Mycena latifolia]|nr:hypothetical protein FB451DRAFT_1025728 [Mycena latifolia]
MPVPIAAAPSPDSAAPPSPTRRPPRAVCPEVLALKFVCSRSTRSILNCAVIGADTQPYFHVVTRPGETVLRTNGGRAVAAVEWVPPDLGGGAYVELCDKTLEKQRVAAWLGVSRDASYRVMSAHGQTYVWVPRSQSICVRIYSVQLLAKIAREDDIVTLEIAGAAVEAGLLEMCVVCVVLFQSGCRID